MALHLNHYKSNDNIVSEVRLEIIQDIIDTNQNKKLIHWYDNNWDKQEYMCADVVTDDKDNIIWLSASEITHNGKRLKVCCRQYMIKEYRSKNISLNQTLIIPRYAEIATALGIKTLWVSFDGLDKRLERYRDSLARQMSCTDHNLMPYYNKLKPEGYVMYKGIEQLSFICEL